MSVIFYLIIFFIVVSLIRSLNQRPPARNDRQPAQTPEPEPKQEAPAWKRGIIRTAPGSGQNEIWMQTAGQLHARFLRPDENSPYPRIQGKSGEYELEISLLWNAGSEPQLVYKVIFGHALKTDLTLVKTKDSSAAASFCQGAKPIPLSDGPLSRIPGLLCAGDDVEQVQYYIEVHQDILQELFRKFESVFLNGYGVILKVPNALTPNTKLMQSLLQAADLLTDEKEQEEPAADIKIQKEEVPISAQEPEPAAPVEAAEISAETDIHTLAPLLFSAGFPGAKEKDAFDAVKDKRVRWTGTLRSAYEFSSDFTFGNQKGVKATFEVLTMEGAYHSKITVKAVVALPPQDITLLRSAIGKTLTFEGTLLKFEGFAREIYLKEGILK